MDSESSRQIRFRFAAANFGRRDFAKLENGRRTVQWKIETIPRVPVHVEQRSGSRTDFCWRIKWQSIHRWNSNCGLNFEKFLFLFFIFHFFQINSADAPNFQPSLQLKNHPYVQSRNMWTLTAYFVDPGIFAFRNLKTAAKFRKFKHLKTAKFKNEFNLILNSILNFISEPRF